MRRFQATFTEQTAYSAYQFVDCTTGTFEFEFSTRTGSAEVRRVQTVVRVREATVTFDFRTRIAELRRYTRNATSLYVPGPQLTRRLRVHRICMAGVKVVVLVVDRARLCDARRGNAKHDEGRCRGENLRHDQLEFDCTASAPSRVLLLVSLLFN
jgi:hypothetical protein